MGVGKRGRTDKQHSRSSFKCYCVCDLSVQPTPPQHLAVCQTHVAQKSISDGERSAQVEKGESSLCCTSRFKFFLKKDIHGSCLRSADII